MKKFLAMTAAALLATATMASAATLSTVTTSSGEWLQVTGPAQISFTLTQQGTTGTTSQKTVFLIHPDTADEIVLQGTSSPGNFGSYVLNQGAAATSLVDFAFASSSKVANNFAQFLTPGAFSFTLALLGPTSYLAVFDRDTASNNPLDVTQVRIDVTSVPVPAGGLLLLSGLAGLGVMRRRKQA